MNFKKNTNSGITMVSSDTKNGEVTTSERVADWEPQDGGLMHMSQVICISVGPMTDNF